MIAGTLELALTHNCDTTCQDQQRVLKHFTFPCSQERLCLKTKPSTTPVPKLRDEKAGCQSNNFDNINSVSKKLLLYVWGFSEAHVKGINRKQSVYLRLVFWVMVEPSLWLSAWSAPSPLERKHFPEFRHVTRSPWKHLYKTYAIMKLDEWPA